MNLLKNPPFTVGEVVFYQSNGVCDVRGITEIEVEGNLCPYMEIIPKRNVVTILAPFNSSRVMAIKTFAGANPLALVTKTIAKKAGIGISAKKRWAPQFNIIEKRIGEAASLQEICVIACNLARSKNDEHPPSTIDIQRILKWCIADTLAAVLKKDTTKMVKLINKLLIDSGKLPFPD